MMVILILGLLFAGVAIGAAGMRRIGVLARRVTGPWRPGVSLLALMALLGAGALVVRGAEVEGIILIAAGLLLAMVARRRPRRSPKTDRAGKPEATRAAAASSMSPEEARRMLGVGPEAGQAEIEAAFRRLMQRAHPDLGGTSGLAAQLNAAREALIR